MIKHTNRADSLRFLKDNIEMIISRKKSATKHADSVLYLAKSFCDRPEKAEKAADGAESLLDRDVISVRSIINTTNLLDSYGDVHIPGIWKKSLKDQAGLYLLEEHNHTFKGVISDDVTAYAKKIEWRELGLDFDGKTEALVFDSRIEKARNEYMFEQYARGYVKNHSVGMRYEEMHLCIDSEEKYYIEEKENWDKYIDEVVNRDAAVKKGYFWAVTEAKAVEGSAVLFGANWATPVQSVKEDANLSLGAFKEIDEATVREKESIFEKLGKLKLV
ncbi:MAG: hypothetical protein LBG96_16720 [Tannerella sp.]|jgi:hypothetical protein|nr:hypothetical protein [Tannerella sp.]